MKDLLRASRQLLPEPLERAAFAVYRNARHSVPIIHRRLRKERKVVIVATPHKVGSTWLFHLVRDLGRFENRLLPARFMERGTITLDNPEVVDYLLRSYGCSIYKSHSYPVTYQLSAESLDDIRFLTMYRDPRDVIVSASFYVATLDPESGGWGTEFAALSVPRRVQTLISQGDFLLTRLEQWYHSNIALKVRYEDLLAEPTEVLSQVSDYVGIDCGIDEIRQVCEKHSFKSRSGRERGQADNGAFLRKGIAGDWKNAFDPACTQAFKEEKDGRWNRLLVEMGYEQSLDW